MMNEFEQACDKVSGDVGYSTQDNAIEFFRNAKVATATFCQPRYVTKIKKLAEQYPNEVQIVHENEDSSIVAHFPTSYIKISRPREYSEEQRAIMSKRLRRIKDAKNNM